MSFNVGDKVTVWDNSEPRELREIVRVAGRKVVDNKGDEWIARSGWPWGSAGVQWYTGSYIRATEASDAERVEVVRLQIACKNGLRSAAERIDSCESLVVLRAIRSSLKTIVVALGEVSQ